MTVYDKHVLTEDELPEENERFIGTTLWLVGGGGPETAIVSENDDGTGKIWWATRNWGTPWIFEAIRDKVLVINNSEDGCDIKLVDAADDSEPETQHNLVIYFKFCLFGTVWGHTAHATDPRTVIRL